MAENNDWTAGELIDAKQPFVEDIILARQMLQTITNLDSLNQNPPQHGVYIQGQSFDLNVRTPKAAIEFIENTLSDWFETVAQIQKSRDDLPYLVDRSLYSAIRDGGEIEWNQGLRRIDFVKWFEDEEFMDEFRRWYPRAEIHTITDSDEPLSGYYNRILPTKIILRVLASMALEQCQDRESEETEVEIEFGDLREKALNVATYAREWLSSLDAKSSSTKGSEIAVGFPDNSEKAAERFQAQFVGVKRKKVVSGALIEMGFINLTRFMGFTMDEVRFTSSGWRFAMMENPIIDGGMEEWREYGISGRRFSDEEIEFLLEHFKQNVPAEWELMTRIARSIKEGCNRPQSLEQDLLVMYGWEKAKMSQMRNGAISRMEEIGLINREKKGREVTYSLTDLCRDTLLAD